MATLLGQQQLGVHGVDEPPPPPRKQPGFNIRTLEDFGAVKQRKAKRKDQSAVACENCRRRKTRCHGGNLISQSPCDACLSQQRLCVWPNNLQSKRLKVATNRRYSNAGERDRSSAHDNSQIVQNGSVGDRPNTSLISSSQSRLQFPDDQGYASQAGDMQDILSGISGKQVYELVRSGALTLHTHVSPPDIPSLLDNGLPEPLDSLDPASAMKFATNLLNTQEEPRDRLENSHAGQYTQANLDCFQDSSSHTQKQNPINPGHSANSLNQIGEIQPIKTDTDSVRVQYYRHFGPTAIVPGRKRVSLRLKCRPDILHQDNSPSLFLSSTNDIHEPRSGYNITKQIAQPGPFLEQIPGDEAVLFDINTNLPKQAILDHLLDCFFRKFGDHFPFLNQSRIEDRIKDGEASSFLICAICALGARFSSIKSFSQDVRDGHEALFSDTEYWSRGGPFATRAKSSLAEVVSVPSVEHVAGFLILAWVEFGDNNDSGLWMYTGMAVRMTQDLGLHRERSTVTLPHDDESGDDVERTHSFFLQREDNENGINIATDRLLFWSVFVMDTTLCWGTGRGSAINFKEVTVKPPTQTDIDVVRSDSMGPSGIIQSSTAMFPYCVKMMVNYRAIIKLLNASNDDNDSEPNLIEARSSRSSQLHHLRDIIIADYQSLPADVIFSGSNYRAAINSGQAGVYLALHLFFHSILACILRPSIRQVFKDGKISNRPSGTSTPVLRNGLMTQSTHSNDAKALDATTNSIIGILTVSDMVDDFAGLAATPFVNQCLFASACICLEDIGYISQRDLQSAKVNTSSIGDIQSSDGFLCTFAKSNYHFIRRALQKQAEYFSGVRYIYDVLSQREQGLRDIDIDMTALNEGTATVARLMVLNIIKTTQERPPGRSLADGTESALQRNANSGNEYPDIADFIWFSSESLQNINEHIDSRRDMQHIGQNEGMAHDIDMNNFLMGPNDWNSLADYQGNV